MQEEEEAAKASGDDATTPRDSSISSGGVLVHPGHLLLVTSLPFCLAANRAYRKPLDDVVRPVLRHRNASDADILRMEEGVRRAIGSAVASRALKVATLGSFGAFGLFGSLLFYACGHRTVEEAVDRTRDWAHAYRRRVDAVLGVPDRVDRDHPEVAAVRGMNPEEELEYISRNYLPNEDWGSEPTNTSNNATGVETAKDRGR